MSHCSEPKLRAVEIVFMKASIESWELLSYYWPCRVGQLNFGLSHLQSNSGGNAYSK